MLVLGGLSFAVWMSVKMMIVERNQEGLRQHCELFATVLALEARDGGEAAVLARLRSDASMRGGRLDQRLALADPAEELQPWIGLGLIEARHALMMLLVQVA
jgi:hypothetical protein